jgi:hypothetical protein
MKIRADKFCSLSTSHSWQAWLHGYNVDLWTKFMIRLRESRGCNHNRDIMMATLKEIEAKGGGEALMAFLEKNYPTMVIHEPTPMKADAEVFPGYNPGILTYPRRTMMTGPELERRVQRFMGDKLKSDHIIVNGVAYIEYLLPEDAALVAKIPDRNWMVRAYRSRMSQT